MSELLWRPKRPTDKLDTVLKFLGFLYRRWYFAYEQAKHSRVFGCMPHYGNNEMFFRCKFLRDGVMYTNYTSTSKCLGLFFFVFFLDVSLSSLRCTLPPSDLSMFPPLSPRLTALEKEALCVRIHNDRWMDWWAGCTLLFPHYRFYWVTLYWYNDWDIWHF